MARKAKSLRAQRDELAARIGEARQVQHQLERDRAQALSAVEDANQGFIEAMAAAGDATGGASEAAQRRLQEAEAEAHAGRHDPKIRAAEEIVRVRQGELETFLRDRGLDLIEELTPAANAIPSEWQQLVNQANELGGRFDALSSEVGQVLNALGRTPREVPVNALTPILAEMRQLPEIPAPLPRASGGVLGTRDMVPRSDALRPGETAFVGDAA